ncbi:MAG: hypothetical protein M0Z82_16895 [Actinomycetota bacterium]|jgi:hypothetical protein|nr:hypothetical protein [Actinomycetota bacterium]
MTTARGSAAIKPEHGAMSMLAASSSMGMCGTEVEFAFEHAQASA